VIVGCITTSYPRHAEDWAGSFVRARVEALRAAGHQVEVLAAGPPGDEVVRIPSPLFAGPGAPELLEEGGSLSALAFCARLAAAIRERAPRWQAVESHWLVPSALLAPALPHHAYAHGGDVALLERIPLGDAIARRLAAADIHFHFASDDLRRRFGRLAGRDVPAIVEPAPFDGTLFGPRPPLDRPLALVLGVGRLVPVKGFDVLIRALARLPPPRPALVLVGEGPERDRLLALARGRVELTLTGALSPARTAGWMRAADLYVQPSRRLPTGRAEGTPLALREAMSVGVPAVASAVGGIAELRGLTLVPPDDPAALALAIGNFAARRPLLCADGYAPETSQVRSEGCIHPPTRPLTS
jgi:glycosyltransferase involved in cell wall biosynthesis